MNKKTLIASAVGIALVGAVGSSVLAGKKLESAYQHSFNVQDKRFKVNVAEFNMGALSGSAKWTGEIHPDLCSPDFKFTFRSEDSIQRGLGGYTIVSKIYAQNPRTQKETYLFDIRSKTTWGGNIDSEIVVPANSFKENKGTVAWDALTATFTLKKEQDGVQVSNIKLKAPSLTITDPTVNLAMKNMSYEADSLSFAKLGAGKTIGKIESIHFAIAGEAPVAFSLNNAEVSGNIAIQNGKVLYTSASQVDNISFQANKQPPVKLEKIQYNLAVKDVNAQAFEILANLFKEQSRRCVPVAESQKIGKEFVKALVQTGITVESKDNQIMLNGSKATAQWESSFPAAIINEKMTDEQAMELVKQMKSQGEVRIDKKFIREGYKMFTNVLGTPMDEAQIEQSSQGFEKGMLELNNSEWKDTVQAKIDGEQLVITLRKEAGKLPHSLEQAKAAREKASAPAELMQ